MPLAHSRSMLNVSSSHHLLRKVLCSQELYLFPITSLSISEREKEGLCSFKKKKKKEDPSKQNFRCKTGKDHIVKKISQALEQKFSKLNGVRRRNGGKAERVKAKK